MGGSAGKGIGQLTSGIGAGLSQAGGFLFGTGKDAGLFGTGQYKADNIDYDKNVFRNTEKSEDFRSKLREYQNVRPAFHRAASQIDQSQQAQMRNRQLALINALEQQAAGRGPSLAGIQLKQATDRNLAQQAGLALAQGGNPALAQRQLAMQAFQMNQDAARQSAMLRAQEQMEARQQLAAALDAARGQDIGLATNQAELNQRAEALSDQTNLALQQLFLQSLLSDQERAMAGEELGVKAQLGIQDVNQRAYAAASQARGNFLGKLGQALGFAVG